MQIKRFIIAALALFVFIVFYEMLVHGYLLLDIYKSTPNVWRSFDEMDANLPLSLGYQFMVRFYL